MSNAIYTTDQITKLATNYILSFTKLQVLKFTKIEERGGNFFTVNVRCVNREGEKLTQKVYINDETTSGIGGLYKINSEIIDLDLENNSYEIVEKVKLTAEEKAKIKEEKAVQKAKEEFEKFVRDVQGNFNYANKVKGRKPHAVAGAKRSTKKHGVEKLESILHLLIEDAREFVQTCINELLESDEATQLRNNIVNRTIKFSPALEGILDQIENSIKNFENDVYANILTWMKNSKDYNYHTNEKIESLAKQYVEDQKGRLMYAAVRYLNDLEIKEVENCSIINQPNGFEGTWKLTLSDGNKKVFRTNTIIAEGYIQRAHYRYLVNLS